MNPTTLGKHTLANQLAALIFEISKLVAFLLNLNDSNMPQHKGRRLNLSPFSIRWINIEILDV